jgi:hypothetical protein
MRWALVTLTLAAAATLPSLAAAETHSQLQAVDAGGTCTYVKVGADPIPANQVVVEGICLNNPEDMLDPSLQWQVFVQGEGGDDSGTAAWAGKAYQSSIWTSELARLNASGFREGDRIRITGYALAVAGKANINERHSADPNMDFTVELLQAGVGLPEPELTTIAAMNTFDATRATGGERYQCRRIRLESVRLQSGTSTWGSNTKLTIVDPSDPNETLLLRLCNVDFGTRMPTTWFHIIGLGNQEDGYTDGYQVWVTRADGIEVPGDCNLDGRVDGGDLALMGGGWMQTGKTWAEGDFTDEGSVDGGDLALIGGNWLYGPTAPAAPVPEPATGLLAALAGTAILRRAKRQ